MENVTLDHKIIRLVCGLLGQYLVDWTNVNVIRKSRIWGCKKNLNIETIAFKVVQIKFFALHFTNQKISFYIFTVGNLQNILMEHDLYLMS